MEVEIEILEEEMFVAEIDLRDGGRDRDLGRRDVGGRDLRDGGGDRDLGRRDVCGRDLRDGGGDRDLGRRDVCGRDRPERWRQR